jgi:hypothetical protein
MSESVDSSGDGEDDDEESGYRIDGGEERQDWRAMEGR